ncbi:glycerol-3-phosphate dehydrogenase [Rubrobacter marinus]|uniref:Glycerol-3-phosphate dehydrogenase n=1 Tax=Rubrobacter marinus TaxID=2653852 RepID=A0A6G8Q0U0_9ACTN|nr:glycerol-3-phosphate dehydrogenase [Rubrobacter marinus]QIN80109.1 glycerol-3-phosphate dehydrogenase [Rubrobacter marinus]
MAGRIPEDIQDQTFDLIVVGAGINGAGIARDAVLRGLKVLLLDKGDLSSGTSSWSSRLIHGGLRYLEYYEFYLVRESLSDREKLLRMAPHLVKPMPFVVPIYEHNKRGPKMVRLGMIAFDLLSFDKSLETHRMLGRDEALRTVPGLNPEGLRGAALYYDCQVEYAERLVVENAISAREHGAVVLTYARVERLVLEDGAVRGVEFADALGNGRTYTVRAPVTVNVSGPWVDRVLASLDTPGVEPDAGRFMGGTKGTHLVVDPFPGAPAEVLYYEAISDNRPILVIPWNGRYLIGTTDIRYEGDLDLVVGDEGEIRYLLQETNALIPEAKLTREDVLFTYSGVRPLPYNPEGEAGGVTRSHVVFDHAEGRSAAGGKVKSASAEFPQVGGLLSIIGGKLTTYRNLARQTTDAVFKKLGRKAPPSATDRVPLPGGALRDFDAFSAEFKARSGLSEMLASRLLKIYGARADDVLAEAGGEPSLKLPLTSPATVETALMGCEVLYAFRREMAQTLADVLLRRSMVAYGPDVALDVADAAAEVAVEHLGWSRKRAEREVRQYREWIERYTPRALATAGLSPEGGERA